MLKISGCLQIIVYRLRLKDRPLLSHLFPLVLWKQCQMNRIKQLLLVCAFLLLSESCGNSPERGSKLIDSEPKGVRVLTVGGGVGALQFSVNKGIVYVLDSSCSPDAMNPDSLYDGRVVAKQLALTHHYNPDEWSGEITRFSSYALFIERMKEIRRNKRLIQKYGLDTDAKILEYRELPGYPCRAIVLWMRHPKVILNMDEAYTCPDVTTGKGYFTGIASLSLLNTATGCVINTLHVEASEAWEYNDTIRKRMCIDLPFAIRNPAVGREIGGLKYHSTGGTDSTEGKAQVLYLEDVNGDGKKLEFALYQQSGCMSCSTTLFGYSPLKDKLINYDIQLTCFEKVFKGEKPDHDTTYHLQSKWIDHAFCFRFDKSGSLNYDVDYRGRGGNWDRYQLHYNASGEYFSGTLDTRP